jgi:hypothetical protein
MSIFTMWTPAWGRGANGSRRPGARTRTQEKSDHRQTANIVEPAKLKDRLRQPEEAIREDQKRIFEINRKYANRLNDLSAQFARQRAAVGRMSSGLVVVIGGEVFHPAWAFVRACYSAPKSHPIRAAEPGEPH